MDAAQAKELLQLVDEAGVSHEIRRHESALNRRAEVGLVVGNLQALQQLPSASETAQALEVAAKLLSDPT